MLKALPKQVFADTPEVVISKMNSNPTKGLDDQEVENRRKRFGKNQLEKHHPKNVLFIFFEQFLDPIIYVLFTAALLGFAFGEIIEGIAVVVVILLTVLIGFFMEWQAVRSMEALRKMTEAHATVLRNGKKKTIGAHELVPGDVLLLESGNVVPADARILEHENLAVKEAALTGESMQVEKSTYVLPEDTPLAERSNMVFNGTLITRGTAKVIVTTTGEYTELGEIGQLTRQAKDESTPIEKKLNTLSKGLIWLTLILVILIAISGYLQGRDLTQMIETAIALAVAAIPEGLPIVASIAMARGMLRLAKDRVIIKKLRAVETLGSTGIICSDKTGTLTENQMSARYLLFPDGQFDLPNRKLDDIHKKFIQKDAFIRLVEIGVLCNNVQLNKEEALHGDPVEIALIELAQNAGFDVEKIRCEYPEEVELPFDAETKMMASLNRFGNSYRVSVKGALENVLNHCEKVYSDGGEKPFKNKDYWLEKANQMAARGLRTFAFAYREMLHPPDEKHLLEELTFLCLVGFIDPPRTDIKEAIKIFHQAGIKVVMVTGDHPETARSIAQAVGLLKEDSPQEKVVTGQELAKLNTDSRALEKRLLHAIVFARMNPSQKLELVSLYQKHDYVVGMTGDGVNDAPALKKADIGIAMGVRGTEAAKEVADVILRDDQFTSIELAIRQGRILFENIRNFVVYLLSCNLAEIIAVALASLSNLPMPLLPLQILYLNLVTDIFPALALGLSEGKKGIMNDPPRPVNEPIMLRELWISTIVYGLGITAGVIGITLFAHLYLGLESEKVNNMAFYTLVMGQLLNVFNLPKRQVSFFKNEVTRNLWVWGSLLLCILLTALGYLLTPLREVLSLVPITVEQLGWVIAFSMTSLLIPQIVKRFGGVD